VLGAWVPGTQHLAPDAFGKRNRRRATRSTRSRNLVLDDESVVETRIVVTGLASRRCRFARPSVN